MGQPYWTKEEEDYFANVIIPLSDHSTGAHLKGSGQKFGELAPSMQAHMQSIGINKRIYTEQNLFQHWYQRYSARASSRQQTVSDQPLTIATNPNIIRTSTVTPDSPAASARQSRRYTPRQPSHASTALTRYVNHVTQTNWTIEPGVNTDGDEGDHDDGTIHPSNIGHIYNQPLLSPSPPRSHARRESSQISRSSARKQSRPYNDEDYEDDDQDPFYDSSPLPACNSAASQRTPSKSALKRTSRFDSFQASDEMDIDDHHLMSPAGQRVGPSKRNYSEPGSASKRLKFAGLSLTDNDLDETSQGHDQEEKQAGGSADDPAEKPRLTMQEALRQVMENRPVAAGQSAPLRSRLHTSSAEPRVQQSTFTSLLPGDESLFVTSSNNGARSGSRSIESSQRKSDYGRPTPRASESATGSYRSALEGNRSNDYTPERVRSRESPSSLPPTRLGVNQPSFDKSPGYSFYSPTGSSQNSPGFSNYSPGFSDVTPARGRTLTRTPENRNSSLRKALSGRDDYKIVPESPLTDRSRGRIIAPHRSSPLRPTSDADEYVIDPKSPLHDRTRMTALPAPLLFDGTPSKSSSEAPADIDKPVANKKISHTEYMAGKSANEPAAVLDDGTVKSPAGDSPATEGPIDHESTTPELSVQVEAEAGAETTTADKEQL